MKSNSIFPNLSNFSSSYNEQNEEFKSVDHVKMSVLHRRTVQKRTYSKVNTDTSFIKHEYNFPPEAAMLHNSNDDIMIKRSSSNFFYNVKTPKTSRDILYRDYTGDIMKNKLKLKMRNKSRGEKDNYKEKYLYSRTCSSKRYDRNMYSNHFLLNKSCAYLKSKCVRKTNFDLEEIGKKKKKNILMHNLNTNNINNQSDVKDGNETKQNCLHDVVKRKKENTFLFKINEEQNSVGRKSNRSIHSNTLTSVECDSNRGINKHMQNQHGKCAYDLLKEYEDEYRKNCFSRGKRDDGCPTATSDIFEKKDMHISEINHHQNNVDNGNFGENADDDGVPKILQHSGEVYSQGNSHFTNSMHGLMKIKLLINKNRKSSRKKNGKYFLSDCKENNKFVKFLMAEVKIETQLYKLILFLLVLILLSWSKNISDYVVITRKCYNVYESPIKSVKRLIKYILITLKIGYKFSLPLVLYMVSFLYVLIIRTFVILNIPILILIIYCKFFLKNEESIIRIYFVFVSKMYKYLVFKLVHIFKNCTKEMYLNDFLSVIYNSFLFIFIYIYITLQKLYNHMVR
ncbi:conserved Plasmodium protein, unknown function [Plasmodium ovale]|uniref:Uncharacterized protein n=1 Tax=Plasmodium ovale TaxID=36330 RepID=A0A1C3KRR1_PLAOA|nr:conserved Plasmodium protein, unknown function [Plasmodium ovale]